MTFSHELQPAMSNPSKRLLFFLSLIAWMPGLAAADDCVFMGEKERSSLYEDGDIVIGGLFPLHYSPVSSFPTYKTEPTSITYKL